MNREPQSVFCSTACPECRRHTTGVRGALVNCTGCGEIFTACGSRGRGTMLPQDSGAGTPLNSHGNAAFRGAAPEYPSPEARA